MKKIMEIIQMLEENENTIPIIILIIFVVSWHQGVQSYLKEHLYKKEDHEEDNK